MKVLRQLVPAILFTALMLSTTACNHTKNQQEMKTENDVAIFPRGEKLPNNYFTGDAYLTPLLARDKNNDFVIGSVSFEPGARTNWHTHPKGQVLIVTGGEGLYQQKGKPAQRIKKGDVITIPENTEHWHGASPHSSMTHIAITSFKGEENVVWLQPVADSAYSEANNNN